ncbi:T9SS-dependent choice-of-anchor J family protein [Winogradskyella schleiferi]|uniref:T9SS-dependent choice-of-anchor J family protein n=1 Tax=Winogradskyella schleiferi TaxID=2686078 RepID=UPI0015C04D51|nr:choice-of-anchor J domain-containing protein [Winogradskyella schleiferi]
MIKKITLAFALCFAFTQITAAQTYFSDDFSSGNLSSWTLTDSDNDTSNWMVRNYSDGVQNEHASSASWNPNTEVPSGALSPDNWMVSPAIDLTSASGNVFLEWKAYGQDQSWANENYTVYVGTASDIATLGASSTTFNEIVGTSNGYVSRNLEITSFVGQTVYIAFRHHNVSDQFRLNIDDVTVKTIGDNDAELVSTELPRYGLVNTDYTLNLLVNNTGGNTITSLEVSWTDGTSTNSATIATSIAGGGTATVSHPDFINYASTVETNIDVTITAVNGVADSNPTNNSLSAMFNTMTQSGTKAVFIEEATGTWCGFCPRGALGMDYMASTYPNTVVAVAVHNSDPMAVAAYDAGINQYIGGYPSGVVDRKIADVDPSQASLEAAYDTQINEVVPVDLSSGATQIGNTLNITANASFYTSFSAANFRLGVIISEDGVTGTGSGYAQVNYYSGGGLGSMGGYENLPDPVPAAQMVYDHVGRALLGGFTGQVNSVPSVINSGDVASYDFTYTIPASSEASNMHIVVVLIDATDGSIVSAQQSSISEALSVEEVSGIDSIKLYPNPATDKINIALQSGSGDYNISVTDMLGRTVINTNYEGIFGTQNIELPVSELNAGHYIISINDGNASYSAKFIINN